MLRKRKFRRIIFSPITIYIFRCILGFSAGYYLMETFPQYDLFWALISVLLVISPEGGDSPRLSVERVKANFIGAVSGIIVYALPLDLYLKIIIGIAAASLLCKYLNLVNVSRSAVVSLIIVMIERQDDGLTGSLERFLSVTLGCIIGLLITVSTAIIIKFTHRKIIRSIYKR